MVVIDPICMITPSAQQISGIRVSIIIPAYNEEKNLGNVLPELHDYLELVKVDHEIIVVNDGSTDKTKEIAYRNGTKILSNKTNQGKGYSLRRGFDWATGDIVVTMDADGSHDPKDIGKLILPVLNGTDIAVGSRFNTAKGRETTTKVNLLGNRLINLLIRIITGGIITDSQSGFRAYKSKVVKEILVASKGFDVETELTLKPIIRGYSLEEVPIFVRKRANGLSRLSPIRDGFKIMKVILLTMINA